MYWPALFKTRNNLTLQLVYWYIKNWDIGKFLPLQLVY